MHPNELNPLSLRRLVARSGLHAITWVDRDVLRSGSSEWTDAWPPALTRSLGRVAGAWPVRLLLGNDLYALAFENPDDRDLARARRRR
jgi:hypothetical protein